MVMLLWLLPIVHQAYGAYPLERDLSQVARVQLPKKWLVFLDTRIWRCMRMFYPKPQPYHDLLSFQRCFVTKKDTPETCYERYYTLFLIISRNNFKSKFRIPHTNCLPAPCGRRCPVKRHPALHISVHKMFHINITLISFKALGYVQPVQGNCESSHRNFTIAFNGCSHIYCGVRYPWSLFVNSNSVEIRFPFFLWHSEDTIIDILAEVSVIDRQLSPDQCGYNIGGLNWGHYEVRIYQINVEMLYQIYISVLTSLHRQPKILMYDGPRQYMPKLPPYKLLPRQMRYRSSTFQALVFIMYPGNTTFEVIYDSNMAKKPYVLIPRHVLHLKNNTGCGNNGQSWMCILSIVVPRGSYAELEVSGLTITGPYATILESAGVAIYNVINNKKHLVGHLSGTIKEHASVTATERRLLVSVYGYSPFALLSGVFIAGSSHCIGQFVQAYTQPCNDTILRYYSMFFHVRLSCGDNFYMSVNVHGKCFCFQYNLSPYVYFGRRGFRALIHFDPASVLRVDYYSFYRATIMCDDVRYLGTYEYIYGYKSSPTHLAMGDIRSMYIHLKSKGCATRQFAAITVSRSWCVQSCHTVNILMLRPNEGMPACDICEYHWFGRHPKNYRTVPNKTVTLERLYGVHPITVRISSLRNIFRGGISIWYNISRFTNYFQDRREFRAEPKGRSLWRVDKDVLSLIHSHEYGSGVMDPTPRLDSGKVLHRESYGYFVVSDIPDLTYNVSCGMHGASLLTIDNNQELRFVVERIMLPLKIEYILAETVKPVGCFSK